MDRGTITSAPIPRQVIASQFSRQALSSQVMAFKVTKSCCTKGRPTHTGSPPGVTSSPGWSLTQEAFYNTLLEYMKILHFHGLGHIGIERPWRVHGRSV